MQEQNQTTLRTMGGAMQAWPLHQITENMYSKPDNLVPSQEMPMTLPLTPRMARRQAHQYQAMLLSCHLLATLELAMAVEILKRFKVFITCWLEMNIPPAAPSLATPSLNSMGTSWQMDLPSKCEC